MRTVRAIALVLSVAVLSSSLPAFGAVHTRDGESGVREPSPITIIVKRIIQRFLGIITNDEISLPKPAPANVP